MNERHAQKLDRSKEEFNSWRASTGERLDLTVCDLSRRDLSGRNFSNANFDATDFTDTDLRGTDFTGSSLFNCTLTGAKIDGALFRDTNLSRARFALSTLKDLDFSGAEFYFDDGAPPLIFERCKLVRARLRSQNHTGYVFKECDLTSANCSGVSFNSASFEHSCCERTSFSGTSLVNANCEGTNFTRAAFNSADLTGANIYGADFLEAVFHTTILRAVVNAPRAHNLEKTLISSDPELFPTFFSEAKRSWFDRYFDWEHIRTIGRLQVFGVSYFLLIYLMTMFYVVGEYNEHLNAAREWATEKLASGNAAEHGLAKQVLRVQPFAIGRSSVWLLFSTLVLVVASSIYTFACPSEVKDFSSTEWRYSNNKALIHYWPLSWRRPWLRAACAALYLIGGIAFLWITICKLLVAVQYAYQYVG